MNVFSLLTQEIEMITFSHDSTFHISDKIKFVAARK